MRINFDAEPICAAEPTGIGMVEIELCKRIVRSYPENDYRFTFFSLRNTAEKKERIVERTDEKAIVKAFPLLSSGLYKMIGSVLPLPYRMFFGGKSEITHFFNFIIPFGVKGKKVCTIHDLAFKRYPETVNLKTRKYLEYSIKKTIKRADKIVVVSKFTADELVELYGVPKEKIAVIYNGVDFNLYNENVSKERKDEVLAKRDLKDGSYFFYLGTIEPRKNIYRMVGAYAKCVSRLKAEGKEAPRLVLGGRLGWYYDEILQRIKSENIEDNIRLLGYIDENEKPALYSGSLAFMFPSLYEGFGLPVAEAMACGTPVLTSNSTSLAEIAGNSAVLCDPLSEDDIAEGMYRLATEQSLREKLSKEGPLRAKEFDWDSSAEALYELYKSVLSETPKK